MEIEESKNFANDNLSILLSASTLEYVKKAKVILSNVAIEV